MGFIQQRDAIPIDCLLQATGKLLMVRAPDLVQTPAFFGIIRLVSRYVDGGAVKQAGGAQSSVIGARIQRAIVGRPIDVDDIARVRGDQ
jgi:hypothetical protein